MKCQNCGTEVRSKSRFCHNCGVPIKFGDINKGGNIIRVAFLIIGLLPTIISAYEIVVAGTCSFET